MKLQTIAGHAPLQTLYSTSILYVHNTYQNTERHTPNIYSTLTNNGEVCVCDNHPQHSCKCMWKTVIHLVYLSSMTWTTSTWLHLCTIHWTQLTKQKQSLAWSVFHTLTSLGPASALDCFRLKIFWKNLAFYKKWAHTHTHHKVCIRHKWTHNTTTGKDRYVADNHVYIRTYTVATVLNAMQKWQYTSSN